MSHCAGKDNSLENFAQGLTFKGKSHIIRATSKTDYSFCTGRRYDGVLVFYTENFCHRDVTFGDKMSACWHTV